jgi:hypothetical protein
MASFRVNTARGRVKARNLKKGARVALAIIDPHNPYRASASAITTKTKLADAWREKVQADATGR